MNIDPQKNKNINSSLVAPLIAIICFFVLLIGTSFAYHPIMQPNLNNVRQSGSTYNVNLPKGCNVSITYTNCDLQSNNTGPINYSDNIISANEFKSVHSGYSIAQTSCNLNVNLYGNVGCTCNLSLDIEPDSSYAFSPLDNSIKEYTAKVTSKTGSNAESTILDERNLGSAFNVITDDQLSLTSGSSIVRRYQLTTKFYNNGLASQKDRKNATYKYKMKVNTISCNNKYLNRCSLVSGDPYTFGSIYSCYVSGKYNSPYYQFVYIRDNPNDSNNMDLLLLKFLDLYQRKTYWCSDDDECPGASADEFLNYMQEMYLPNYVSVSFPSIDMPGLKSCDESNSASDIYSVDGFTYWLIDPNGNSNEAYYMSQAGCYMSTSNINSYNAIFPLVTIHK